MIEDVCSCGMCQAMWMGADGVQSGSLTAVITTVGTTPLSPPPTLYPPQSATAVFTTNYSSISNAQGVQYGTQWSGDIRYTFPVTLGNYESNYADSAALSGASATTSTQRAAVRDILGSNSGSASTYFSYGSVASIIASNIYEVSATSGVNGAEVRVANSSNTSGAPAYAYLPSNNPAGGDVWIASNYTASLQSPVVGSYGWMTHIHELGHALGLKHAHQASQYNSMIVNSYEDDMEFTVMSYRSYSGQPIQYYVNETYGFAQTLMMYDIAALQSMYGADFSTNAGNTTYTWNPNTGQMFLNGIGQGTPGANRIFLTTWDGGGVDTYDLSNYSTNLHIDLSPGGYSTFSIGQLALLDAYNGTGMLARGNVYNALLWNYDARSYIEKAIGGTGNDVIYGNDIANVLNGGSGSDTLYGRFGDDTLVGGAGNDTLNGEFGTDTLIGDSGNDTLDGGVGFDTLRGGIGDDTYLVEAGDALIEQVGEGTDTVQVRQGWIGSYTLQVNLENMILLDEARSIIGYGNDSANVITGNDYINLLYGLGGDDTLNGGLGADILYGSDGDDLLDGGGGGDTLYGDVGNDTFIVDDIGDAVNEAAGQGTDTVRASVTYVLDANIENLTLAGGAGSIGGTGNASDNLILGNSGNNTLSGLGGADTLDGAVGADTLIGGADNDSYMVDNAGDVIVELAGEGTDAVVSSTSYTLSANVENLTLASGAGSIRGAGNALANVLLGNQASNTLSGFDGNDTLNGGAGNDVIDGGAGFDTAAFDGPLSQYQVIWDYDFVQVARSGETDTLYNVEQLDFAGSLLSVGSFGPTSTVVEAAGVTQLVSFGVRSYLRDSGGAGPSLKYQGAAFVEGQFGAWMVIGAEQTAGGYQAAWKNGGANQYVVWNLDGDGNYVGSATGVVAGSDMSLQLLETAFQQDLNGNGQIGAMTTTIETFGATRLVGSGGQFFLRDAGGTGPSLKYQGAAFVEGQFGAWMVIGAEQTAGGYQAAWKNGGANQYVVWNLDGNGNYVGSATGVVAGSDMSLQLLETAFQQDLNGNGQIGATTTTIETFGATRLIESGGQLFLRDAGGAGPSLKYQGAAFVEGQFGAWTVIGAEQTAGGFQAAWKNGGASQYVVWNLDGNGNYVGNATGYVPGSDMSLQLLETAFQQDLNGNGQIGPVTTTIESFGATRLVESGGQFFLRDAGGAGPSLKYQGAAFVEGQFGTWTAIGAEQTSGGYMAAFKNGAADQYVIWNLDGGGNYLGNATTVVAGSDRGLQAMELAFHQDLNGDSQIGSLSGSGSQELRSISADPLSVSTYQTLLLPETVDTLSILLATLRHDV